MVYVVLDEFPFTSTFEASPEDPYSWCLSRDRRFVSVEMVWLGPSPGRRRLRFSFQINDVKDQDRLPPTPPITPGGGEERLSSRRLPECQSILSDFFAPPLSRNLAQKTLGGRRGASLIQSLAIRLRLENLAPLRRISRIFSNPGHSRRKASAPSGERRI